MMGQSVRVAIAGVGNCASSLVQGARYYRDAPYVLVSSLPVGSEEATRWYAERALEAGCAFVNRIPVFIASDPDWARRFSDRRVPIIGDDIKFQVGGTIVRRVLTNLFRERGVWLDHTYQLNFGGDTDFLNMLERLRAERFIGSGDPC